MEIAALQDGHTATAAMVERLQRGMAAEAAAQAGTADADAEMPEEAPSQATPAQPSLDLTPETLEAAFNQHNDKMIECGADAGSPGALIAGFLAACLMDHCPPQSKRRKLPDATGSGAAAPVPAR